MNNIDIMFAMKSYGFLGADQQSDDVNFVRSELTNMLPKYKRIRDCIEGEDAIKEGREIYLPAPLGGDNPDENLARYNNYLRRAVFYPVLKQTSQGLRGQCFMNKPICDVPEVLKPMIDNVDGASDIFQFASHALGTNINFARGGILTDMDIAKEETSLLDNMVDMPSFVLYQPEDIINWRYKLVKGRKVLSKLVLREFYDTDEHDFKLDVQVRWRVLYLDNNNRYNMQLWVLDDKNSYIKSGPAIMPLGAGKPFTYIPFEPLSSEKNTLEIVCTPQMDSLASLNIGHFRNSADYEESCFMNGQGTLVVTGLTKAWYTDILKKILRLGALGNIPLEKGSDAKVLQIAPNSMPIEAMRHKEEQMLSVGAKIIQPSTVVKTATESSMNKSDENSILTMTSKNTSDAITGSLRSAYFLKTGKDSGEEFDKIKFELLTESAVNNLTPQQELQLVDSWQKGAYTDEEMRARLKGAGYAFSKDWKKPIIVEPVSGNNQGKSKPSGTVNTVTGGDLVGNKNNN